MYINEQVSKSLGKIWESAHHLESDILELLVELEQHKKDLKGHDFVTMIDCNIEPAVQQAKIKTVEVQALVNYCEALIDNF